MSDTFFEINFVEHENPFYPLGKRYTFVLSCEAFTYSHEDFDTNQDFIDDIETDNSTTGYELYMSAGVTQDFIPGELVYQISGDTDSSSTDHVLSDATSTGKVYEWDGLYDKVLLLGDVTGTHLVLCLMKYMFLEQIQVV